MAYSRFDTLDVTSLVDKDDVYLVQQNGIEGALGISPLLELIFPVGSVELHSVGSLTPEGRGLPGVWEAIEDDTALTIPTQYSAALGEVTGSNSSGMVLPEHNHSAQIYPAGAHSHSYAYPRGEFLEDIANDNDTNLYTVALAATTITVPEIPNHAHSVILPQAGSSSASINTVGKSLPLVCWKRIG